CLQDRSLQKRDQVRMLDRRIRVETQISEGQGALLLLVIVILVDYARPIPSPENAPTQSASFAGYRRTRVSRQSASRPLHLQAIAVCRIVTIRPPTSAIT